MRSEVIHHRELGWLRALLHEGGGLVFESLRGTGDLPGCSFQGPVELVEVHVSWSGHPRISKKKKKKRDRK